MNNVLENMRVLGVDISCPGSGLIVDLYYNRIKLEQLTSNQVEQIRYAWNTRKYIPESKWNGTDRNNVFYVKPKHHDGESREEFSRRYIANILEYLHDSENEKWKSPENPSLL